MTDLVELWFVPSGGMECEPIMLELRAWDPRTDPPSTYQLGDLLLVAGCMKRLARDGKWVTRIDMVASDYCE